MMKRRGVVGALAALFPMAASGMPHRSRNLLMGGVGSIGTMTAVSGTDYDRKWRLFSNLMRKSRRHSSYHLAVAEMLGGLPPSVHSNRSWAPWFKAQRAAAWHRKIEDDDLTIDRRLRKQIFGDAFDD